MPQILDESLIDEHIPITLDATVAMCKRLASQGLFVGPSSGAFVHGALRLVASDRLGTIVTALSDTGESDSSTGTWRR